MSACAACGTPIGDEAWAAFREDAGFVQDIEAVMPGPLVNYDVHARCREGWSVPDGYSLAWEMPSVRDRERRCHAQASRQALSLRRIVDGYWDIDSMQTEGTLIGTITSEGYKLPDGRVVPGQMTLGDVETFLGISYAGT